MILNNKSDYDMNNTVNYGNEYNIKYRCPRPDKSKIIFRKRIHDKSDLKGMYNSINLGDRSIIVKKISLSNMNNPFNSRNHQPISLSVNENKDYDENMSVESVENQRLKLFNLYNNRMKKNKMIILIQSFIRRFLTNKKYYNELKNKKVHLYRSKRLVYRKKVPSFKNLMSPKNRKEKIIYKYIDTKNSFFTKSIIVNHNSEKSKISKIQKFWRNRKINYQIGNYSRISNYQCQSEIIKKFNGSNKISLIKRPKYDSLFNSLKSLKYFKDESHNNFEDKSKLNKQSVNSKEDINIKLDKNKLSKLFLKNNIIKRPQFIKLYNKVNRTSINNDYFNDEDIYHYKVDDINKSFKDKSFTLFHDKNKNGNYIQQMKSRTEKKLANLLDIDNISEYDNDYNENDDIMNYNFEHKINNNLKIWQKSKINCNYYEDNIFKYKNLKPNKNFIFINSTRAEKLINIKRKNDIVSKPNHSKMKKIKNNKNAKKNHLTSGSTKIQHISKYFINDDGIEPKLSLERKFIMRKPHQIRK